MYWGQLCASLSWNACRSSHSSDVINKHTHTQASIFVCICISVCIFFIVCCRFLHMKFAYLIKKENLVLASTLEALILEWQVVRKCLRCRIVRKFSNLHNFPCTDQLCTLLLFFLILIFDEDHKNRTFVWYCGNVILLQFVIFSYPLSHVREIYWRH